MNDEIKEILDNIEVNELKHNKWYCSVEKDNMQKILDYITNLQQQLHQASLDIQELTEKDIGCPSWCDKLTNLQQELEKTRLENKVLREQMIAMVQPTYTYGISGGNSE